MLRGSSGRGFNCVDAIAWILTHITLQSHSVQVSDSSSSDDDVPLSTLKKISLKKAMKKQPEKKKWVVFNTILCCFVYM